MRCCAVSGSCASTAAVDVEMLADRLARALHAVLPHLLEGEAALGAQIVVGLRQPAIAGGAEQFVVEGPADLLRLFDIEGRAPRRSCAALPRNVCSSSGRARALRRDRPPCLRARAAIREFRADRRTTSAARRCRASDEW